MKHTQGGFFFVQTGAAVFDYLDIDLVDMPDIVISPRKLCSKCGERRLVGEFYKTRQSKDGLRGSCKACYNAPVQCVTEQAEQDHKARHAASSARWRKANPDKDRAARRKYQAKVTARRAGGARALDLGC